MLAPVPTAVVAAVTVTVTVVAVVVCVAVTGSAIATAATERRSGRRVDFVGFMGTTGDAGYTETARWGKGRRHIRRHSPSNGSITTTTTRTP